VLVTVIHALRQTNSAVVAVPQSRAQTVVLVDVASKGERQGDSVEEV